jgi:hypothetical protein
MRGLGREEIKPPALHWKLAMSAGSEHFSIDTTK